MRGVADESWMQAVEGEERVFFSFDLHPQKDEAKSEAEGRPVFRDVEYIQIQVPGDKGNVVHRPVTPEDKQRFSRQYEHWKNGKSPEQTGMPLTEWAAISRSEVLELAYFNVRTVEQLASLTDANAQNVGALRLWRDKAKAFLEQAKGNAPLVQMQAELVRRDNDNATLKHQLEEQAKELAELKAEMKSFRKKG